MFTIKPGNPKDFSLEELQELQDTIRSAAGDAPVHINRERERGYDVTLWEVLNIVSTVGGAASAVELTGRCVAAAVRWMQARWRREKTQNANRATRPRCICLYDGSGHVIRRIVIDEPGGEARELPLTTESRLSSNS